MHDRRLRLYAIFHLNLAYSSIEVKSRPEIIKTCYWPLLQLIQECKVPLAIEASGVTLEIANEIDPQWGQTLRRLVRQGVCEFIGSGYTQLIGPLVPAKVNRMNLRLGHEVYQRLVGCTPRVALVNEQAYSAGLISLYREAGYDAMVMEWDNPARSHSEWDSEWKYLPQFAVGQHGEDIPVIWNTSMAFQKFQRYAHGHLAQQEYVNYLARQSAEGLRALSLYGNDAEIFDFRPGRYESEPIRTDEKEWDRIRSLFDRLTSDERFQFVSPHEVLSFLSLPHAGHHLQLESAENPIPVKKQPKYNILRWAVSGRDDGGINTACWNIYETLSASGTESEDDWRELCYLWSSDFRTHITEKRWSEYRQRLAHMQRRWAVNSPAHREAASPRFWKEDDSTPVQAVGSITWEGKHLCVETEGMRVRLNCQRGLAIDALWFKALSARPLIGTLEHGYFDDIAMGADFYSGHLVLESPGQAKLTDLNPVEPDVVSVHHEAGIVVQGQVATPLGPVKKTFRIGEFDGLRIQYDFEWEHMPLGALRLGHLTLMPESFDPTTLTLATHNGGSQPERFSFGQSAVDQGRALSFLISGHGAFGMTERTLMVGDDTKAVVVDVVQSAGYLVPMLTALPVGHSYFWRVGFSAREYDDTTKAEPEYQPPKSYMLSLTARPLRDRGAQVRQEYAAVGNGTF